MEKICNKCNLLKPSDEFFKNSLMKDGLLKICKSCRKIREEECLLENSLNEKNLRTCTKCNIIKSFKEFGKQKNGKFGLRSICTDCSKVAYKKYRKENLEHYKNLARKYRQNKKESYNEYDRGYREKYHKTLKGYACRLLSGAIWRSKKKGLEYNIDTEWVLEHLEPLICEATGLELSINRSEKYKTEPFKPTLDRIDSSKGYTKDNTRVTCWWWNVMKQDWSDELITEILNKYYNERKQ